MGKAKAISQLNIEKINLIKIIFFKNIYGEILQQNKNYVGETLQQSILFILKKNYKAKFSTNLI